MAGADLRDRRGEIDGMKQRLGSGVAALIDINDGQWVEIDYDLPTAAAQSGLSQYELLTGLGDRFERRWR